MYPHDPGCIRWDAQGRPICVCEHPRPYRIRKMPQALNDHWFMWRRTPRGPYELVYRAATFTGAVAIVDLLSRVKGRNP